MIQTFTYRMENSILDMEISGTMPLESGNSNIAELIIGLKELHSITPLSAMSFVEDKPDSGIFIFRILHKDNKRIWQQTLFMLDNGQRTSDPEMEINITGRWRLREFSAQRIVRMAVRLATSSLITSIQVKFK